MSHHVLLAVLATMRPLIDDVESRNKVRKCSLVPLTIATSALAELGRTDATSAILKAANKVCGSPLQPLGARSVDTMATPCADAEEVGPRD